MVTRPVRQVSVVDGFIAMRWPLFRKFDLISVIIILDFFVFLNASRLILLWEILTAQKAYSPAQRTD